MREEKKKNKGEKEKTDPKEDHLHLGFLLSTSDDYVLSWRSRVFDR